VSATMDRAAFEALYTGDADPWGYGSRAYERAKYIATLRACGPGPFARALELGGSIGVFSALLAPRCVVLDTLDFAPTAVAQAAERLGAFPGARVRVGVIPRDLPPGPFNLVVASEVLYYLDAAALGRTLAALRPRMAPGARLVAVHLRRGGSERPLRARAVHLALRRCGWLRSIRVSDQEEQAYLLDVLVRR
jgi:SAM-dependent methyltransferase